MYRLRLISTSLITCLYSLPVAKLKLSHKALILVAVPLVFELGFVATLNELLTEAEREAKREAEAREIVAHINRVLRILMESAGAVSAYGITGLSEEYGTRAESLRTRLPQELAILDELLKHKPEEKRSLDKIKSIVTQGDETLRQIKKLYRQGAFQDANARMSKVRPLIHLVAIEVDNIRVEEEKIEFTSPKIQEEQRRMVRYLLAGGVIFNILLAISLAIYFNRGTTRRLAILMDNSRRLAEGKELNPMLEGNDEIAHLDHVFNDMARKLTSASDLLKETEARLRLIVESLPIGLIMVSDYGIIQLANPTIERMFGYPTSELIGEEFATILANHDSKNTFAEILQDATGKSHEVVAGRKDESTFPAELSLTPIETREGKRFLALIIDITERHEVERLKQEFIAMVSHELKTPLSSVQNYLELLAKGVYGTLSEKGSKKLPTIESNIQRLINLIKELLDVERLESGKMSINPHKCSTPWIVERAFDSVRVPADEKKIQLVSKVESVEIFVDADRIVQVIINLLSNAVKFSPPESAITVSSIDGEDEIEFMVTDQGRGVPASHLDKVFEKFQQVTADDSRKHGGTGLGLAICKAIVEQHGGQIGVNSTEGKGSTFWFRLPKRSKNERL